MNLTINPNPNMTSPDRVVVPVADDATVAVRRRVRSALYVDFDNMFGGLLATDATAAFAFAETPLVWLDALSTVGLDNTYRDFLVRRVYLNPHGTITDPARGRIYLSSFRAGLTHAGLEVIDCPSLTRAHKNAADIRIALDAAEAAGTGVYDEFIIASSDADFAPLLQRLRASDHHTVIMSTNTTARAYRNLAHTIIGPAATHSLTHTTTTPGLAPAPAPAPTPAPGPDGGVVAEPVAERGLVLPGTIERLCQTTLLARVPSNLWPQIFAALIDSCANADFTSSGADRWVRDRLNERGVTISRATLNRIIAGLAVGGVRLDPVSTPTIQDCTDAVATTTIAQAHRAGWFLTDAQAAHLHTWLTGHHTTTGTAHLTTRRAAA